MVIDRESLCELCDLVSVATACGPAVKWAEGRLAGWRMRLVPDGYLLALPPGAAPEQIRTLYVSHIDEIGGYALGPHPSGGYYAATIGAHVDAYAGRSLQAMDWRDEDGGTVRPIDARADGDDLVIEGDRIEPYATVFTYDEKTRIEGDWIHGKAVDPRLTAFAVVEAAKQAAEPSLGVLLVFAEECSIHAAEKGAAFVAANMPNLQLVVNCDVPGLRNIEGWGLERAGLRITERGRLMDPHTALALREELADIGAPLALGASRSGSQTPLFTPHCPSVSVALPAEQAHVTPTRASLVALEELMEALVAIPRTKVAGGGIRQSVWV